MSNEDVDDGYDSDENLDKLKMEVARLRGDLEIKEDQILQQRHDVEEKDSKLQISTRQAREWERIAVIVQGLGKDEDDLIKIMKEKDKLELDYENLKVKLKDLQNKIDNFDKSREGERTQLKQLETELRSAKMTISDTEQIRKTGSLMQQKIQSLKNKADKAELHAGQEKKKTEAAQQEKAKALLMAQQAEKKITRQAEMLGNQKKEIQKLLQEKDEMMSQRDTFKAQWTSAQQEYEAIHREKMDISDAFKAAEKRFAANNAAAASKDSEIKLLSEEKKRMNEKMAEMKGWKSLYDIVDELAPKEEEKKTLEAQKIALRAEVSKEENKNRKLKSENAKWEEDFNAKQGHLYEVLAQHKDEMFKQTQEWKQKISKAHSAMELEKQRADELEGKLAKANQEKHLLESETLSIRKEKKLLNLRVDSLEGEITQLSEDRDTMRDIVECTQTEMSTLLGALKNMETALDRMRQNEQAVEESKFLKEKCGSLEAQVKDYQKQMQENMERYMKQLKEGKDKMQAIAASGAKDGAEQKEQSAADILAEPQKEEQEFAKNVPDQGKDFAARAKLKAERDVLKGELDKCWSQLRKVKSQRDSLEVSLMSRDTEIGNLRDKLQEVLRSVSVLGGMDSETSIIKGMLDDMSKFGGGKKKSARTKKGQSVGAKIAQRKISSQAGPRQFGGRKQAPRRSAPRYRSSAPEE